MKCIGGGRGVQLIEVIGNTWIYGNRSLFHWFFLQGQKYYSFSISKEFVANWITFPDSIPFMGFLQISASPSIGEQSSVLWTDPLPLADELNINLPNPVTLQRNKHCDLLEAFQSLPQAKEGDLANEVAFRLHESREHFLAHCVYGQTLQGSWNSIDIQWLKIEWFEWVLCSLHSFHVTKSKLCWCKSHYQKTLSLSLYYNSFL